MRIARPLSKGWPPPPPSVPTLEPNVEPSPQVVRQLNFRIEDVQPVKVTANTLVGMLGINQKKDKI